MKKVINGFTAILLVFLFVSQFTLMVLAGVDDEYLNREVEWSSFDTNCRGKTQPAGAASRCYASVSVFLYNADGELLKSGSKNNASPKVNAWVDVQHILVDKARVTHYVTDQPKGAGNCYGYVYEYLDKGEDL